MNGRQRKAFKLELASLINKYSLENESNTPDYIIAEYLADCLKSYNKACVSNYKRR